MGRANHERQSLRGVAGYVPGEQTESGVKLNTNENPYPPSPGVARALARFPIERLRRYPPPTAGPFRAAAARVHGVGVDEIVATNGGDELLRLALATFVEPGEAVGIVSPSYTLYRVLVRLHGARLVELPMTDDWRLPEGLAASLDRAGARLAFLVNPHAPSGRLFAAKEVCAIAGEFDGVLLVDEAYVDFVDPAREYDLVSSIREHPNLLILRTLSKGYSLAGLRFGYGIGCASLIEPIASKTKDSFNTDLLAQELATAAVEDRGWATANWAKVRAERERLRGRLRALGLPCPASESNFLLVSVDAAAAGRGAEALYRDLRSRGVYVRWFDEPRLADRLRISVGTPEENDRLLEALEALLIPPRPRAAHRAT